MKSISIVLFAVLIIQCKRVVHDVDAKSEEVVLTTKFHSPHLNQHVSLGRLADSLHSSDKIIHIRIDKSDYLLTVLSDTIPLKSYPVVFGGNPVDDKLREGDGCTPEGTFKIKSKYPHSKWTRFIWIDYPNETSWKKYSAAKQKGLIPSDARIGGEIGIHGVPEGYEEAVDQRQNWTLGCISMKNADIKELYNLIDSNTSVEIIK